MKFQVVYEYDVDFDAPLEQVWSRVSDTNRLHEVSGAEAYTANEAIQSDKSIIRYCRGYLDKANVNLLFVWDETLAEWKAPYYMRQQRNFERPFRGSIVLEFHLTPIATGTKVHTKLTYFGDSFSGWLFSKLGVFKKISNIRCAAAIDFINAKEVSTAGQNIKTWKKPIYNMAQISRIDQIINKINTQTFGNELGKKIAGYIMYSLLVDVSHIRPIHISKKWELPEAVVIEAFLQSMVLGLLEMRWDILCPQCRTAKLETAGLHEIPKSEHCGSCNIDFSLNFNENVEMTFLPAKWLREVGETTFCMLSAQLTPHIIAQLRIPKSQKNIFEHPLKPGVYRCRALEDRRKVEFVISESDTTFPVIQLTNDDLIIMPEKSDELTLINNADHPRYFLIEDLKYKEEALTGQKVTSMHVFRQLCPEQLIKPGDNIGISQLTILFTDLKDSTAFYYEIGESNAYRVVREHFSFLSSIIYKNHGSLVKTIGDSVMAVFYRPQDSIAACLEIRESLKNFNATNNCNITIKLGVHQNNCIAVNINNILDYFGTAINVTARLHGLSDGDDIIVSDTVMQDQTVQSDLANYEKIKCSERVKGVPDPVEFYRVYKKPS